MWYENMKQYIHHTLILLAIALFLETNIVTSINAQTINTPIISVNQNGKETYTTIQEAIANAPPYTTINICTGSYYEILTIEKPLTLIGEDRDTTIIYSTSQPNKYTVKITASHVTLKNLNITNKGSGLYTTGVRITAPHTTIQNCNIHHTPIGIVVWTTNNTIQDCTFWNCTDEGIALLGTLSLPCNNNQILRCTFYNNNDGIELQHASYNIITNCVFYHNTHTGIDAITTSNNHNTISNCTIHHNDVHGIYLAASSYNHITNCNITNNKNGNIITTKGSHNNTIKYHESTSSDSSNIGIRGEYSLQLILIKLFKKLATNSPLLYILLISKK